MLDFGSGPGGSMISGKWINRNTGAVITVRDSFIDDSNNMILMTDKGQLSMSEFSKYYIQASDEMYDESGKVIANKPVTPEDIKVSDEELKADPILFSNETPTIMINNAGSSYTAPLKNFDLIDKIFKKTESKPKANLKIEWADFPKKELEMLINYFDVDTNEISEYISKYLLDENLLTDALSDFIHKQLLKV